MQTIYTYLSDIHHYFYNSVFFCIIFLLLGVQSVLMRILIELWYVVVLMVVVTLLGVVGLGSLRLCYIHHGPYIYQLAVWFKVHKWFLTFSVIIDWLLPKQHLGAGRVPTVMPLGSEGQCAVTSMDMDLKIYSHLMAMR